MLERIKKDLKKNKAAVASLWFLLALLLIALIGPWLTPYQPGQINYDLGSKLQPPSFSHPFGTDNYGRDILSRCLYGSRITLVVGFGAVIIFIIIGTILGAVSGYSGGMIDNIIMRIVDVMLSLPLLFFILVVQLLLSPSIWNVIIVIGITSWAGTCRLVRGQVLSVREMTYIDSARSIGASDWRIITHHVLPNVMGPVIVNATLGIAGTILLESVLSFLGFGVQEPLASWGSMLHRAQTFMFIAPWMAFFPGFLIVLTVLAFNFLGDGLRDALDPRIRK
ncbi:MAG: ABC transporter permease [Vulcanimicrobiota bacterium]